MELQSDTKYSDFEVLVKKYIEKLNEIIEKLNDLCKTIANHHHNCNIAKTAGTAVSSTGVAIVVGSVLFAPFTGGTTLIAGAGGAIMSVTGSLSNVITDYIDYKTSNMIMNDIHAILKSKEDFDCDLKKQLNNLGKVIEKLIENGIDEQSAILVAIKGIASGCIDLTEEPNMKLMNTISAIVKMHHVESAALETLPIIGRTMHISEKTYQFIYNIFGLSGHTGAIVFRTIGRISSVISVAFTLVDIALLIKDWSSEHPTVEIVTETVKKVEEEKEILSDLLEVFDASRDEVKSILHKVVTEIEYIEENEDAIESGFVIVPREVESF